MLQNAYRLSHLNVLNVAGESSQSAFDVQYEVPPTEGELSKFGYKCRKTLDFIYESNKKTLISLFLGPKKLKLRLETQTMTKGKTCFLPLRRQNQQRITKEITASRNKDNL